MSTVIEKLKTPEVIGQFQKVFRDEKKAATFLLSLRNSLIDNPLLLQTNPETFVTAGLKAAALDLMVDNSFGFAYVLPYKTKNGYVAQFQIGYKGFIQLAQRSGVYKTINSCPVYEKDTDEAVQARLTSIFTKDKPEGEVIGYAAYFKLLNGFEKTLFMSNDELLKHAGKYSSAYKFKKSSSLWTDNFDAMATKTVLKLLISKYGPLDANLSEAIKYDQMADDEYIDNKKMDVQDSKEVEKQRVKEFLLNAKSKEELDTSREYIYESADTELITLFEQKEREYEKL